MKSGEFMLFLNFFLPAALLSNQRGFWKSKNIPIFAIYGYNVSQSMSSGHTLRMYSFLEGYWNCALASSFFSNIEKSCPQFEFLDKNWLEFLPEGQILSFFGTWVFAKMLKKKACCSASLSRPGWRWRSGRWSRCPESAGTGFRDSLNVTYVLSTRVSASFYTDTTNILFYPVSWRLLVQTVQIVLPKGLLYM